LLIRSLADDDRGGGGAEASLAPMSLQEIWREKKEFPLKVLLLETDTREITDVGDRGDRFLVVGVAEGARDVTDSPLVVLVKPESLHIGEESRRSSRTRDTSSESGVKKQLVPWKIARRNCSLQASSNCFLMDAMGVEGLWLREYL
jgi:hypothetical protein